MSRQRMSGCLTLRRVLQGHVGYLVPAVSELDVSDPRLVLPRALFLDRELGGREDLEPLVRDRVAALDREAIGPRGEALLCPLDGRELRLEVSAQALVELVLVEVRAEIPGILVVRLLGVVLVLTRDERPLDSQALGAE